MKCPKCGYNSFEYLDSCKKCNGDLAAFKTAHGIRPVVLPAKQLAEAPVDAMAEPVAEMAAAPMPEPAEFSWHDEPEPATAEAEAFPALEFDLPQQESETFSFNMDEAAPEPATEAPDDAFKEFSLEGFESEAEPAAPEVAGGVTAPPSWNDTTSPQEEPGFGEFAFDGLESETIEATANAAPEPTDESLPDFFSLADQDAPQEAISDDGFNSLLESGTGEFPPSSETLQEQAVDLEPDAFTAGEQPPAQEAAEADGTVDLLGLSPEEYEALFGESPLKKKAAQV